jgi:hypothetical protein
MAKQPNYSKAAQAAVDHWKSLPRKSVEVPEWQVDGVPLTIYWSPWTLAQRMKIFGAGEMNLDSYIEVILLKAEDSSGAKLYSLEDKPAFKQFMEPTVIARVALEMMTAPKFEDIEKN